MVSAADYRYQPTKAVTFTNYPLTGNPHRHYYTTRNRSVLMAVQHITAGLSDFVDDDSSAESTVRYSASTATVASYHGIVDSDSVIDCLPDSYTAFAQGVSGHNFNSTALSLEIGLRDPDWLKPPKAWVDATIRNAARWWAPRVERYGIPLRVMTDRDEIDRLLAANKPVGFVEHHVLDPFNRADAGYISRYITTFPWSLLFTYIRAELAGTAIPKEAFMPDLTEKEQREILDSARHFRKAFYVRFYVDDPKAASGIRLVPEGTKGAKVCRILDQADGATLSGRIKAAGSDEAEIARLVAAQMPGVDPAVLAPALAAAIQTLAKESA